MAVNKDKVISDFRLIKTGQKGWMYSPGNTSLKCPKCNNQNGGKLAFAFIEETSSGNFKCVKCGYHTKLETYLWKIGRKDLISKFKDIDFESILKRKELIKQKLESIEITDAPQCPLPILFKRLYNSNYLDNRGCSKEIYQNWTIGISDFDDELKNYIIFIIKENNINVGWVARSSLDKNIIDSYNKGVKEYNSKLKKGDKYKKEILRWKNSTDTEFSEIVFGLDEITENTETIICVEGITSKLGIDVTLELYKDENIKSVCTFGKKISDIQIKKIFLKGPNIQNFILFYDPDAVQAIKQFAFDIQKIFPNTLIAFNPIKKENGDYKDPGDMDIQEFDKTFQKLQSPFQFFSSQLSNKKLTKI